MIVGVGVYVGVGVGVGGITIVVFSRKYPRSDSPGFGSARS